jgi:hypothetical protein
VHADTQGQSVPVFALATLFGFDLIPRIRNFKDLIFFRPDEHIVYPHVDELFGERGRNVIDWKLIERHWQDVMQVAISISEGRLSSATLMRRLRSNSRKNRIYKVFREVGRSVRAVALLRYLADPQLRARTPPRPTRSSPTTGSPAGWDSGTTASWPATTRPSRKADQAQHPARQPGHLPQRHRHHGRRPEPGCRGLAHRRPARRDVPLRSHISRFGAWATDDLARRPEAFNPVLVEVDFTADLSAAA